MDLVGGVFTIAVDDVFAVECVVVLQQVVRRKAVGIDGKRLLLAIGQQGSNRRFVRGFRRDDVPLVGATIDENEDGGLSLSYEPRSRVDRPRERDSRSRSRPFFPAET